MGVPEIAGMRSLNFMGLKKDHHFYEEEARMIILKGARSSLNIGIMMDFSKKNDLLP